MIDVVVVGVGVAAEDLANRALIVLLTPAFYMAHRDEVGHFDDILQVQLERGEADIAAFGDAMNESHRTLRDLYEVSCFELDAMVSIAQNLNGCYGARLTGAGFGGCSVNLVAAPAAETFRRELAAQYEKTTGQKPEIYVCQAAKGANVLSVV